MKLKSKLFASAVAFTMVLSMVAIPAAAQTTAELTAQINSLLAMIAQLQAQIAGGTTTTGGTYAGTSMFDKDLTIGSTGSNVVDLQRWLVNREYLVMPVGVAYGYFGSLTKAAIAKFQVAKGITPAVGYFGPITRSALNAMLTTTGTGPGTTTTTPGCGAGATYSSTTGALCTTTTTGATGITTPGAEGTIAAVEASAGTVSKVYEGDSMAPLLGIKITAAGSDMAVQRMKFDLDQTTAAGTGVLGDTAFYNKIYKKLYITEGGNVLASVDLNSSTVVKDGTDYLVSITGFNSVVPKGSSKTYLIKADLYSGIDSADYSTEVYQIAVTLDGVRAVDGAGIDDYAGTTAIAAAPTVSATLAESATLTLSLNSSSPKKTDVICAGGAGEDECDYLSLLVFDMKAEKDSVLVTDLNIQVDKTTGAGAATASTTVYLYEGSTAIDSATITGEDTAVFSDIDFTVAKDATRTFTVKADIRDADNAGRAAFTAVASSSGVTDENSAGDSVADSGTATGNAIGVLSIGPEFTLVSKSITTDGVPLGNDAVTGMSTSTITATFNIKVKAVGAPIIFGTSQATTTLGAFVSSTTGFTVYINGANGSAYVGSAATSTSITFPSTCTVIASQNSCTLAEGTEVTVPVSFQLQGRTNLSGVPFTSGLYSIGIARLQWLDSTLGARSATTFMAGEVDWRTNDVSFP